MLWEGRGRGQMRITETSIRIEDIRSRIEIGTSKYTTGVLTA